MPNSPKGPTADVNGPFREERFEASNLQAAIGIATERAFETMAADLAEDRLKPDRCIFIQNDKGETIHIIRFRDLIENPNPRSN